METAKENKMADMPEEKKALLEGTDEFEEEEQTPAEESEEPETDTKADTEEPEEGESDTKTETVLDDDPHKSLMDELNLTGQYKSSEAALRAVEAQRQHIEDQRQELYELRQVLQDVSKRPPAQPKQTPEQIRERILEGEDPLGALTEAGFVRRDDLEQTEERLRQLEAANTRIAIVNALSGIEELKGVADYYNANNRYPPVGYNDTWDSMLREYNRRPGIRRMSDNEALVTLYDLVKSEKPRKPPVNPVSEERKSGATTSSRSRSNLGEGSPPDWNKMTSAEIRKYFEDRGLID